jgi:small-conductance mechanosensitive channel
VVTRPQAELPTDGPQLSEGPVDLMVRLQTLGREGMTWLHQHVLTLENMISISLQLVVIITAIMLGRLFAPGVRKGIDLALSRLPDQMRTKADEIAPLLLDRGLRPALWIACLWIGQTILAGMGQPHILVRIAASLATAWLIIRLVTQFLPEDLRKPVTWFAWGLAVLNAFGFLDDVWGWVNSMGIPFGRDDAQINVEFVLRAAIMAAFFLYAAQWLSKRLKARVETLPKVEPSIRILLGNAIQIGLFVAAAFLTMTSVGIPLGGLAVFGGALGVGLGFGMQQIVANFISGVILLTDRSIKPHDVIEVDETYGEVKSLGLRYASVITRDGKEHLIPNEQLVTNKVVNWSYTNSLVRVKRRFLVEYESDLRLAAKLAVEAAQEQERVMEDPAPKCLLMEFGDDAVIMEARFWIRDPQNGINNIGSEVMFSMWDKFKEHGIDLPLGQDEIRIMGDSQLNVKLVRDRPQKKDDQ